MNNLATFLGVSPAEASKCLYLVLLDSFLVAESNGWARNGDFVVPAPSDDHKVVLGTSANLQSLSEYVVYLETDLSVPHKATEKSTKSAAAPKGQSKGHAK